MEIRKFLKMRMYELLVNGGKEILLKEEGIIF